MNNEFSRYVHEGLRQNQASQRSQRLATIFLAALVLATPAVAADLKPETIQAWQEYVNAAEARNRQHLAPGALFLSIDAAPADAARLREGEIIASPATANVPVKVPSGLIHDWTGAAFIPNAAIRDVLRVTRDYGQYSIVYHPNVVSAKVLETGVWEDRFSMVVMNKSFFAKSALDSDYRATFTPIEDNRWYSTSESTRVQEISEYGSPSEHTLPEGQGTGIIWRLYSIARYEERDGGVYIELEAIALSRDVPAGLRFLVNPIVRRVSRSAIVTSLQQTADVVTSGTSRASGVPATGTRSFR